MIESIRKMIQKFSNQTKPNLNQLLRPDWGIFNWMKSLPLGYGQKGRKFILVGLFNQTPIPMKSFASSMVV